MTAPPTAASARHALLTMCPCAFLFVLLALPATGQTTQPYRPMLLAHGSASRFWIATIETTKEPGKVRQKTLIRGQVLPGGEWQDVGTIFQPALALAEVQGDLAVLLDDGMWKRVGAGGLATGPTLPGTGPVFGWGSSSTALYAVRAVEGGRAALAAPQGDAARPATSPTTTTTTAATQASVSTRPAAASRAATRPAPLVLMQYDRGQWVGVADLPSTVAAGQIALTVTGDKALIATPVDNATAVRTFVWADGQWQDWGEVRLASRFGRFGLLAVPNLLALWTTDAASGAIRVDVKREGEAWRQLKDFSLPADVPPDAQRVLAVAGEEFRLEVLKDGKLLEQRYDLGGAKRGSLSALPTPVSNQPSPMAWILQSVALLVMVVVLITFYRRRAARTPPAEE